MKLPVDCRVVIPTAGRADETVQTTLKAFLMAQIRPLELVVQHREEEKYCRMLAKMKAPWVSTTILPPEIRTLGKTWQWIIDDSIERDQFRVLIFDDDIQFSTNMGHGHYTRSTKHELQHMIRVMYHSLDHFAQVGIGYYNTAGMPNRVAVISRLDGLMVNERVGRAQGYRADVLKDNRIRMDRFSCVMDFDTTLRLLIKGYANAVWHQWVQGERGKFNAPGGTSRYRTDLLLRTEQEALKKLYSKVVTLRQREFKHGGSRQEVMIRWKQAYRGIQLSEKRIVRFAQIIQNKARKSFRGKGLWGVLAGMKRAS
jgi:hypothetical protein